MSSFDHFYDGDRRQQVSPLCVGRALVLRCLHFSTAAIALAVAFGVFGAARAEEECGRLEGGAVTCSPANYDAAADGNIVYRLSKVDGNNVVFQFIEGLSIRYDRDNPDDDQLVFPGESGLLSKTPLYSAVRIATDADYAGNLSLFSSADVTSNGRGISIAHQGTSGALRTEISGGNFSIDSEWLLPHAIHSYRDDGHGTKQKFSGDHDLIVRDVSIDIKASPEVEGWSGGIVGVQGGEGDLNVDVQDSKVKGNDRWAAGIASIHSGNGDMNVDVQRVDIDVEGSEGVTDAVYGYHLGSGNSNIKVRDAKVKVRGDQYSNGIAYGYWSKNSVGNLSVDVRDVDIQVHGERNIDGIFGMHKGEGAIDVDVHGGSILVDATIPADRRLSGEFSGDSGGIAFIHDGPGPINITARDVDIDVRGDRSAGIGGGQRYEEGKGNIAINVHDSTVMVTGEQVAGVRSFNMSGEGRIDVAVNGGTITARGEGSSGILVGLTGRLLSDRTGPIKAPAGDSVKPDGSGSATPHVPLPGQVVLVDGYVRGGSILVREDGSQVVGAGVRLYGGGQVRIGPQGSISADSGVAVQAEGEEGEDVRLHVEFVDSDGRQPREAIVGEIKNKYGPTIIQVNGVARHDSEEDVKLHVAFDLNGRQPSEAIVVGEIRNDDGPTTIQVNGVVLHDSKTGATVTRAPNGVFDVSMKPLTTAQGQAFKLTDFVSSYAPRAAVFETLPGFMLRLDQGEDAAGKRLRIPGSPMWIKVSGGQGSYDPHRSHVGATYDFNRFETEAGVEFGFAQESNMTGWAALRYVNGSADVAAPTGGGRIDASGFGASAGASWENSAGYYASGSVSLTRYDTDLREDGRGLLKDGVGATLRSIGIEAGRRFSVADHLSITPQAWLTRSDISMEDFQDAVGSRFSLQEATQSIAGLGIVTESTHAWDDGERTLDLRGRLGVEQVLGDGETVVEVSGERLGSKADRTRLVLGLGAVIHWSQWSLGGEVAASALGSDDNHYTAGLRLGKRF